MKTFGRAVFATLLFAACPASAEKIDFSVIKCKDFLSSSKENIGLTLAWLDAYYKEEDAPPVLDTDKLGENAKKLGEYCAANPDTGLITASDQVINEK